MPKVAIILLNWNGWKDTIECLESLQNLTYPEFQVIVVDNGSSDESIGKIREWAEGKQKMLKPIPYLCYTREQIETGNNFNDLPDVQYPLVLIHSRANLGFSGGNNIGIRYSLKKKFDFILLLNNDTVVDKSFIEPAINLAIADKRIGIVGGKIYYYSDPKRIWSAGGSRKISLGLETNFYLLGQGQMDTGQFDEIRQVDWVVGANMLIKSDVFEKIGLMPDCYFLCMEEGEFAVRAQNAGYKIFYVPQSVIWHKIGISNVVNIKSIYNNYRNRLLFMERNRPLVFWKIWFFLFEFYINYLVLLRWKITKYREDVNLFQLQKIAKLACNDHKKSKKVTGNDIERAMLKLNEQ